MLDFRLDNMIVPMRILTFHALCCFGFSLQLLYTKRAEPEAYMDAGQVIKYNGYPLEEHNIETKDGFILSAQRIPHGRNNSSPGTIRPAVLLQHGVMAGSDCFVLNLPPRSLGFILADAGYDVWLSNSRGNVYSMRHRKYNSSQNEFWDWSWQQMGQYDLPATIDYVLNATGQSKLFYVGHSQGTAIAFAQFSIDQELSRKVKLFIALAPIATVTHVKGFMGFIAPILSSNINGAYAVLGRQKFLANSTLTKWYATRFCDTLVTSYMCSSLTSMLMGFDTKNLNLTRVPVYQAHATEGTSMKNMIHYAQEWKSGNFQMYDYGSPEENIKHYNQSTPPVYDPTKMTVPTALFSGENDWLSDPEDVSYLLSRLPNIVKQKKIASWNHVDFVLGMDAPSLVYQDILNLFKLY